MKKTRWLYTIMALLMLLTACGGEPAAASSASVSSKTPEPVLTQPGASEQREDVEMTEVEIPTEFPGDHDGERPVITMLAKSYENGSIIEIPQ